MCALSTIYYSRFLIVFCYNRKNYIVGTRRGGSFSFPLAKVRKVNIIPKGVKKLNKMKKVTCQIEEEQYQYIESMARQCGMTVSAYMKRKLLDRADSVRLQKEASYIMADLYYLSEQSENLNLRKRLRENGDRLCQCLKW